MIVDANSIVEHVIHTKKKRNNETCQWERKNYCICKKNYTWKSSTCISKNGKYLKSIASNSIIACDEIINATYSVSTNLTNSIPANVRKTISINVTSTVSIKSDD